MRSPPRPLARCMRLPGSRSRMPSTLRERARFIRRSTRAALRCTSTPRASATVATTVPNFVRGLVVVVTSSFVFLRPSLGLVGGALAVGGVFFALALASALSLRETFGIDFAPAAKR